jgi:hypothetical protein
MQIMALMATYVFTLKVGIDMITPTIIIGAIADRRITTEHNALSDISEEQMTWIGELNSYRCTACYMKSGILFIIAIFITAQNITIRVR